MSKKKTRKIIASLSTEEPQIKTDSSSEDTKSRIDYALKVLERMDTWIDNCDNKISILLGALEIVLTILLTTESISKACSFVLRLLNDINLYKATFLLVIFIDLCFYVISVSHVIKAVFARIDSDHFYQNKMSMKSNVFFGSVSKTSFAEYKDSFMSETTDEKINDILSQVYINSVIATKKYRNYNKSLKWTVISVSLTVVVVIWALVGF